MHNSSEIICLLLGFTLSLSVFADSRGRVRLDTGEGDAIQLYGASYALLIGVSDYTAGWPDLESIPRELDAVKAMLKDQGFQVVKHLNPDSLTLERAFNDFIADYGLKPDNRLLFFFAGHGHTRKQGTKGYLVPTDAPVPDKDERGFVRKALSMIQVMTFAREIEARHALFLFDSCFSGTIFESRNLPPPPQISRAVAEPVRQFITAGGAGETVPSRSVFTPAFIDALRYRKGDLNGDGYITGSELGVYLNAEVPQYVSQVPQFGKIREYDLAQGDFVFEVGRATTIPTTTTIVVPPSNTEPTRSIDPADITKQLKTCEVHFNANRLTSGKGGTALECYTDVLEKEPHNREAQAGLERMEERYAGWINNALNTNSLARARRYMESLRKINSESPRLDALEERLEGYQ